jgi:hypothetical protein
VEDDRLLSAGVDAVRCLLEAGDAMEGKDGGRDNPIFEALMNAGASTLLAHVTGTGA